MAYIPATGWIGSATPLSAATTLSARAAYVRRAERTTWSTYPSLSRETNARWTGHAPVSWVISRRSRIARWRLGRSDQPAQPHARGHGLAGGAEVRDDVAVERGQGRHRRHVVAELGVVVVLDHDRGRATGGGEEREPVCARHHRPERVLVGGRDVRRGAPAEVGHRLGGRYVADLPAAGPDRLGGGPVAGVLVRDRAGREGREHLVQAADRPGRHQDLVGLAGQAASAGEMAGELDAELRQPGRVVVRRREAWRPRRHARRGARRRGGGGRSTACRCRGAADRIRPGAAATGGAVGAVPRRPRRTSPSRAGSRASPRRRAGRRPAR